jgi:tRNA A37 threonylcarbamoyladenosine synthetase subunit TsaC/SUA5/YrdC
MQGLATHTEVGAAVRRLALADVNVAKAKLELFLPGRTTFVFDLDDDFGDDLPTQVRLPPETVVLYV